MSFFGGINGVGWGSGVYGTPGWGGFYGNGGTQFGTWLASPTTMLGLRGIYQAQVQETIFSDVFNIQNNLGILLNAIRNRNTFQVNRALRNIQFDSAELQSDICALECPECTPAPVPAPYVW